MKFTIPFDKELYIEQTRLTLPYVFSNERKKIKESLIPVLLCFTIGLIILIAGSDLSTLFFAVGIFAIFNLYVRNENYTALKSAYMRNLRDLFDENEINTIGVFDFREDCLRFSNDHLCSWVKWSDFSKYRITKSNLLLVQKEFSKDVYVIGESEVGEKDFQTILNFVKEKVI